MGGKAWQDVESKHAERKSNAHGVGPQLFACDEQKTEDEFWNKGTRDKRKINLPITGNG